jgi:hypothetical protein
MRYSEFANIITNARMSRYLIATGGNSKKAMTLYRKNLQLSQELFTVISCFEIALRNAIDKQLSAVLGDDWLLKSSEVGGVFFTNPHCKKTKQLIIDAIKKQIVYSHHKVITELPFGFWLYLFAQYQYTATGKVLLKIFPSKPKSTPSIQYNNTYIFKQLADINVVRNRIAHHEPICFVAGKPIKDTTYARQHYIMILQLFQWMEIDEAALLYGLDHILKLCDEIDKL